MPSVADMVIRSLEDELSYFDQTTDKTSDVRQLVVNKLVSMINKSVDPINVADTELMSNYMQLTNTTLKALNDQETSASRRITAKIKQQDQRRADNTASLVAEMYHKMSTGGNSVGDLPAIDLSQTSSDLLDKFSADGDFILDTELRVDPEDLS